MSARTLPLLFLNLGGEMLYILDQRLRAQSIPGDKARKDEWTDVDRKRVMNDIISTMFNRKFMEELFKPQELYSKKALRTVNFFPVCCPSRYSVSRPVETHVAGSSKNLASHAKENTVPNPLAKEELNFLARLLGGLDIQKPAGGETGFRLNLFTTDEEEEHAAQTRPEDLSYKVINIEATQEPARREELSRILGEMEVAEPRPDSAGKGEDLLALMDEL
ncbi:protein OSCP1 [Empidonax traillii]|uniref:protein OSCP1 n=1 Tax=Empidonax traillii TaxID=164674 RepID=UPI000FFCE204|nr:protein OSCP1 [Empidonax traillii]